MSTVKNLTVTKGQTFTENFDYPSIKTGDLVLLQFYENGNPLKVQLAVEKLAGVEGEIIITEGAGFVASMVAAEAELLNSEGITYKGFLINAEEQAPTEIFNGNVTVNGQSNETVLAENFYNGDRSIVLPGSMLIYTPKVDVDFIYAKPNNSTETTIKLPPAQKMLNKKFYIYNLSTFSDVFVKDDNDNLLATLEAGQKNNGMWKAEKIAEDVFDWICWSLV